jgi:transcriptional regulator with XRE-family HTH domain
MSDEVSANLANNMRTLRESRGVTQAQISKLAGLPRPTWANLESGAANPTLQILVKVATALQVSVEELIGAPRATAKLYRANELRWRKRGEVTVRQLLPEPLSGLALERMTLPPGASMTGTPHTPGTREYLTCESGRVELIVSGKHWQLEPGDVAVFRGDQRHAYRNLGRTEAVAYSVVVLAPAG